MERPTVYQALCIAAAIMYFAGAGLVAIFGLGPAEDRAERMNGLYLGAILMLLASQVLAHYGL